MNRRRGKPLAIDARAPSARPGEPAFVARPDSAPVYHGFVVLDNVRADGFTFGMITDFLSEPIESGDAFVVAPDGSRAGLVWEVSKSGEFSPILDFQPDRWGVWAVSFPNPMNSIENATKNLAVIAPKLAQQWELWKSRFRTAEIVGDIVEPVIEESDIEALGEESTARHKRK